MKRSAASESASGRGRIPIALACEVCGDRNYKTTIARRDDSGKAAEGGGSQPLRLKKFCKTCDRHTMHQESK